MESSESIHSKFSLFFGASGWRTFMIASGVGGVLGPVTVDASGVALSGVEADFGLRSWHDTGDRSGVSDDRSGETSSDRITLLGVEAADIGTGWNNTGDNGVGHLGVEPGRDCNSTSFGTDLTIICPIS